MCNNNRIRMERKNKRITLIELAYKLRVKQDYLVKLERGEIEVPQERIEHILSVIQSWRKTGPLACDVEDHEKFRSMRQQYKITILELSEITGVSQSRIARYERGLVGLSDKDFQSLLAAMVDPVGFSSN